MSDHDDTIRRLFKGGGLLLVGLVVQLAISFLGKLIIARGLSIDDFGGVALGMAMASIVSTILILGLNEGVARNLPRQNTDADRRGVVFSALAMTVPLAILTGGAVVVGAPLIASLFNSPGIAPVLRIFGLVIPLTVTFRLVLATVQGQQRSAPKVVIENLARPITRLTALGVVILLGVSAVRVAWAYFLGWFVPVLIGLAYLYRSTNLFAVGTPRSRKYRELLRFSAPLLLSAALTMVFSDLDTAILGYFSSTPAPVGIYNVAYPLASLLNTALLAFGFIFMPTISELHAEGASDRIRRMYSVVTKWIFVVTFPVFIVLVFFPVRTISLTFGAKYASGGAALSVLAVGFFVNAVMGMNRETILSLGATKVKMYSDAGAAALNFCLNIALIPSLGPLGAAIATTTTYICLNGTISAYLYRRTRIVPFGPTLLRSAVVGTLSFLLVYTVIRVAFTPSVPVLIIGYLIFLLVYGVAVVRLGGISEEEVMLIQSIEERFDVDLELGKRLVRQLMP